MEGLHGAPPRSEFRRGGGGGGRGSSPEDVLRNTTDTLEKWAQENKKDADKDLITFWALKIPAILSSASAGVWAHFGLTGVSVVAGAIASLCVIADGLLPRGMLRNTHLRAYHDI